MFTPVARESGESVQPDAFDQPETGNIPETEGGEELTFTSSRLVFNAVAALGAEKKYPYSTAGQLFFKEPTGNFVCSATVQRTGVIAEAGHCVSDGNGNFYSNWLFVPAIRNGKAPFGKWTAHQVWVSNTWHHGGGAVPNAQDVSVIVLNKTASDQ